MLRTSCNQFQTMIDFMESKGDLSRPTGDCDRLSIISNWTKLAALLNRDRTGTPKPVEKWRKVWADFKMNTKNKMKKIQQALEKGGTCKLVLSHLEERVLNLIQDQNPSDIALTDVQVESPQPNAASTQIKPTTPVQEFKTENSRFLKASLSQFEAIVDFMEKHGDINRRASGPQERISDLAKWDRLIKIINLDTTGAVKSPPGWKKVWSDFKHNTRKKAAKIRGTRAKTGSSKLKLSDLEVRVLNVMRRDPVTRRNNRWTSLDEQDYEDSMPQVDILQSPEASTSPDSPNAPTSPKSTLSSPPESLVEVIQPATNSPTPSTYFVEDEDSMEICDMPGPTQSTSILIEEEEAVASPPPASPPPASPPPASPPPASPPPASPQPEPAPSGAGCQPPTSTSGGEDRWQNFVADFATEYLKLRERELQQQAQWQTLFAKFLNIMENITEKF